MRKEKRQERQERRGGKSSPGILITSALPPDFPGDEEAAPRRCCPMRQFRPVKSFINRLPQDFSASTLLTFWTR